MDISMRPDSREPSGDRPTGRQICRFLIPSAFGIFVFLFPVYIDGRLNIPLGIISELLADLIAPIAPWLVCLLVVSSAVMSLVVTLGKIGQKEGGGIDRLFRLSPFYLVVRVVGAIICVMCLVKVDPVFVISEGTGQTMFKLLGTLIAWFFAASFLIPLLLQYGVMDFLGVFLKGFTRPLFRLPGRATVDLLASWIGNCNVGVVLTTQQYESGFYSAREAITTATCFSAASLPFCIVIAAMLGVDADFLLFYLVLCITSVMSVALMCRIPMLSVFPDTYYEPVGRRIKESEPVRGGKLQTALRLACATAEQAPRAREVLVQGVDVFAGIAFSLTPTVMCYGTVALALTAFTPLFSWLSVPFAYYLQLLGVPNAFEAAPGTIVGFVDMLIPAVVCAEVESYKTRFIIGVLSLVQIVYMTEIGTILLTSKLPIRFWHLLVLFLEKTIIALPIIVVLTNLLAIG